ncbi:MAG: OmpA family protein [Bacteroidota bacterium]
MKSIYNILFILLVFVLCAGLTQSQTLKGTKIVNTGTLRYHYLGGQEDSTRSNVVTIPVDGVGNMTLNKTVSPTVAMPGDTVLFNIIVGNTGTDKLTAISIVDTLAAEFGLIDAGSGIVSGNTISWSIQTLPMRDYDTLTIKVKVSPSVAYGASVVNSCTGKDSSGKSLSTLVKLQIGSSPHFTLLKSVAKYYANAGDTLLYALKYKNDGNLPGINVQIIDTLPANTQFVSATNGGTAVNGIVSWTFASVAAGSYDSVRLALLTSKNIADSTHTSNTAELDAQGGIKVFSNSVTTILKVWHPKVTLIKSVSTDSVSPGDSMRYVIHFKNIGDTTLTHLHIYDTLNANLVHLTASPNASIISGKLSFNRDTLGIGVEDSVIVRGSLAINTPAGRMLSNTAFINTDQTTMQSASAQSFIKALQNAALTITKSAVKDSVFMGDTVRYSIRVKNSGLTLLTAIVVHDTLSTSLKNAVISNNATLAGRFIAYQKDSLTAGESDIITITAVLDTNLSDGAIVHNIAYGITDETAQSSSSADVVAKIVPKPSIEFSKQITTDTVIVGNNAQYVLRFHNTGNVSLTNVAIKDTVPDQLVGVSTSQGSVISDSIVAFTEKRLAVGAVDSVIITAKLRGNISDYEKITNTAHCASDLTNDKTGSALFVARLKPLADLTIYKTVSQESVLVGTSMDYLIRVRNTGNMPLTGLVITDTIPQDLYATSATKGLLTDHRFRYVRTDTLKVGAEDSIIISSGVPSYFRPRLVYVNTAYALTNEVAIRSARASIVTRIIPAPAMTMTKTVSRDTVLLGDTLSYWIHFKNTGNDHLTNFSVLDTLPQQLINITVSSNAILSGSTVRYAFDTLQYGREDSIKIIAGVSNARLVNETLVNRVVARSNELAPQVAQAVSHSRFIVRAVIALNKSVSKDTVLVGNSLSYTIKFSNAGNIVLHNVSLVDTIPSVLSGISASGKYSYDGKILTSHLDSIGLGEVDSIVINANVPVNTANKVKILNTAYISSTESGVNSANASTITKVIVVDKSCVLRVSANPKLMVGDGIDASLITALLTDGSGNPKPDGTPVLFKTSIGIFSNGRDSITIPTIHGYAMDSIRVRLSSNLLATALASVSSHDSDVCYSSDSVRVEFFPGAIHGLITDQMTGSPVQGGAVAAYDHNNSNAGSAISGSDGRYLIPIANTDDYRVVTTFTDSYHRTKSIVTGVHVDVPGSGGNPPVPNKNSISGAVYYSVSGQPVTTPNITILLLPTATKSVNKGSHPRSIQIENVIDSTGTDSTGYYAFTNVVPGTYVVAMRYGNLQGQTTVANTVIGQTLVNANIPVALTSDVAFAKEGPADAFSTDTVTYKINMQNTAALNMMNTVVIDSLDPLMVFVDASDHGSYQSSGNRIVWNIGTLIPSENKSVTVRVTFSNSISSAVRTVNQASISSDQTSPLFADTATVVRPPSHLRIWKTVSSAHASLNDTLIYTINVQNNAGSTAQNLTISDVLPVEINYQSSNPATVYDSTTRKLVWHIDSLRVGQAIQFKIYTRVRPDLLPGEHVYTNIADLAWNGGNTSSRVDPASHSTVSTTVAMSLAITKQALKKIIEVGDAVTYIIRVTNPNTVAVESLLIVDDLPVGFVYLKGSSLRDSVKIPDPKGDRELRWLLADSLKAGAAVSLSYRLIAGAGAVNGDGINRAAAHANSNGAVAIANGQVQEQVQVKRLLFSEHGLIIGKVFYDDNLNAYQDEGEQGVKGVELMMEDGTRIITGDDGKYSLPDVLPGEHVIRVRKGSLPPNTEMHAGYGEFAGDPASRFVRVTESGIARADFYLKAKRIIADSIQFNQRVARVGRITVQRFVEPRNIVFVNEEAQAPLKLSGSQFEVGKAALRPEAYPILTGLADMLRWYSDQSVTIAGHTDSSPIHTKEFSSNQVLSESRANAVRQYLIEVEHIDSNRIATIGFGDTRPIMSNKTKEGKAANRRVELHLSGSKNQPKQFVGTVTFTIPINYSGDAAISSLEIQDQLDTAYHFISGTGKIGNHELTPRVEGNNLYWNIQSIGNEFHDILTYRANIYRPEDKRTTISSRSVLHYMLSDTTVSISEAAVTNNELANAIRGKATKFTVPGVTFDIGQATLKEDMLGNLKNVVDILKSNPRSTVIIDGHTDSKPIHTKDFASNVELSYARANTVAKYLANESGMATSQFTPYGWGEMRPIESNSSAEGRQANRRVEIQVYKKEFAEETIPEGLIDSSRVIESKIVPNEQNAKFNSRNNGTVGDQFVFIVELGPGLSPDLMERTLIDSLSGGLMLDASSLKSSAPKTMNGDNSFAVTSASIDVPVKITFTATITNNAGENSELINAVKIVRKFSFGPDMAASMDPIVITVKKK